MLAITNQSPMNFSRSTEEASGVGGLLLHEVEQIRSTTIERLPNVRYLLNRFNLDSFSCNNYFG